MKIPSDRINRIYRMKKQGPGYGNPVHPVNPVLKFFILIMLALAIALLAPSLLQAIEKPPLDLSPQEMAVLEKGDPVLKVEEFRDENGNLNHRLRTYRLIAVPPQEVWKVLSQPEQDREWIPGVDVSQVLDRGPDHVDVHYEVMVLFMVFRFNIHRVFHPDALYIKNDLIPGMDNDLAVADSYYALYPCDNGQKTIMNYSLRLAVSQSIPKPVEDWFARQSSKGWMENLKKRAESNGTWKK
jgi:ribosome-associated toxin RatA of RatAB toxin-antitoxin module